MTEELKLTVEPVGAEMLSNSVSENGPGTDARIAGTGSKKPTVNIGEGSEKLADAISSPVPNGLFVGSR